MLRQIDLNKIIDFLKIVELGNITRAAEALGEPKAKLSRNLALLEQDLKVQLIFRTTRQFKLTDAGRELYNRAKVQFQDLENTMLALHNQRDDHQGKIKLTAPDDLGQYILNPIIDQFLKLHAKLEFEILYTNQLLDLIKIGVDVAFRIGRLKDSGFVQKSAGTIDFILISSPAYLEKVGGLSHIDELEKHQSVVFSAGKKPQWNLFSEKTKKSFHLKPRVTANTYISVRDLVIEGHGVAIAPRFICERDLASGRLTHVLKAWSSEPMPVSAMIQGQKNTPARVKSFFNFASAKCADAL
jgi:LysR family transcriptional regulator, regulator for bpeEF and oprC